MNKDEEMKVRVPRTIKVAFQRLAEDRFTSESELAREAFIAYLETHGVSRAQLRETAPDYKVNSSPGLAAAKQIVTAAGAHALGATTTPPPPAKPAKYKIARSSKKKPAT